MTSTNQQAGAVPIPKPSPSSGGPGRRWRPVAILYMVTAVRLQTFRGDEAEVEG